MPGPNLLGPPPVHLPVDPAAGELAAGDTAQDVARRHPTSCLAWAVLAEAALDRGDDVAGYAYARVGYHRGLDRLRRNGWKGAGPVPWSHEPNRGFLRCLSALAQAAVLFEETDEVERLRAFLLDADPEIPTDLLP
ncbi:DUF3151 domain-containing protein [Nakamurella flavida]|uniref:DUF3151 domain-containing protein n=1 Tax=Nakamurella flavida TaxID=363630 RepID=A0A938YQV4_9ACTN|nr:DUF3151 domain-containing protein [Nakamurella flavida]MBM9477563.1 DUF3151 domain-containing protein [Nakamurella flavida]MDP9779111.1 hypothetical protein [Nakamurella flavida]